MCLDPDQHVFDVLVGIDPMHPACRDDGMQNRQVLRMLGTSSKE